MTRRLRDFRLLPFVLLAVGCLFALKTFGLFSEGGYTLGQRLGGGNTLMVTTVRAPVAELRSPAVTMEVAGVRPQRSWMQEVFDSPGGDITGSVPAPKPKEPEKPEPPVEQAPESKAVAGTVIAQDQPRQASAGERALLGRLQERRQELNSRARELDLRESILKAAEKKLETQTAVEEAGGGGGAQDWASDPAQGEGRGPERPLQGRRHDVRDHEAQGGRGILRSSRHQSAARCGEPG